MRFRPRFLSLSPFLPISTSFTRGRYTTASSFFLSVKFDETTPSPAKVRSHITQFIAGYSMSSDADYEAFLNKANQDTGDDTAKTRSRSKTVQPKAVNAEVPKELESVDEFFVSDSDEPFQPVSLNYDGDKLPSAKQLGDLLGEEACKINQDDFDPRGQYEKVIEVVQKVGGGSIGFFKIVLDQARSEYLVLGVDSKKGRIVGLRALAIES